MPLDPKTGLKIFGPVNEKASATYKAELFDPNNNAKITSLNSLEFSIHDSKTGQIIRDTESILDTNGGDFTEGVLTLTLSADDNRVINQRRLFEDHLGRFDFTYNNGTDTGHHAVIIRVRNLNFFS